MNIFVINKKKIYVLIFLTIIFFLVIYIFFNNYLKNSLQVSNDVNNNLQTSLDALFNSKEKVAYLTFDDGPTKSATPKILDILKEEDVKASFFVIGKYVKNHPDIVKRAYNEGHYIANHGYNHNNSILYKNNESFLSEIKNTDIEISKAIGIDNYCSHIFRFPNGYSSAIYKSQKKEAFKLLHSIDYAYIDWNCLNKDSELHYNKNQLLNNFKKSSKNKNTLIVLMHDTTDVSDSSSVLKDTILYLKNQGYIFRNFYDLKYDIRI